MDQNSRPSHQNLLKVDQTKKKKKKNQQQVKVVHFSNPVRFTTTAADFRSLVQELTGRDSHIADFISGHPPSLSDGGGGDKGGIFDGFSAKDFKVEIGGEDVESFEIYGESFGKVEDFGGGLMEFGLCGWGA